MINGFLSIMDTVEKKQDNMTQGFINVAKKPDGNWVSIPMVVVEGNQEGPVLLVDACNHGDEYEGTEAIIRLARALSNQSFKGTLVGVLAVNFEAFVAKTRNSPIDYANMNRIYPGNPDLFLSNRVAHAYMEKVVKNADYFVSFHGGGTELHLNPIVGYLPTDDKIGRMSRKMAEAFGVKLLWRMQGLPFNGISTNEAIKYDIPSIVPEVGSHCGRLYDRNSNVQICYQGILNVMIMLNMLDGEVKKTEEQIEIELHYLHTPTGGIHTPLKKTMEMVKKGDVLASVTDVFGNTNHEIKALYDAIVVGFFSIPVINPGDWSYLLGKIL